MDLVIQFVMLIARNAGKLGGLSEITRNDQITRNYQVIKVPNSTSYDMGDWGDEVKGEEEKKEEKFLPREDVWTDGH